MDIKLDLGCGRHPKDGFDGVDIAAPEARHNLDLLEFPWPWADNSVTELYTSHFLEHIPMETIAVQQWNGMYGPEQDLLFAFMDEAYRVLHPEGSMTVIVPCGRSDRAFQDPTHRRFFVETTFLYFNAEWRKLNGLDHYNAKCNFAVSVGHTTDQALTLRHPEAQAKMFRESWNVVYDLVATLKKLP